MRTNAARRAERSAALILTNLASGAKHGYALQQDIGPSPVPSA
jgi:hypothetical protein